jgi:superfamily II DNA or RNA helicase
VFKQAPHFVVDSRARIDRATAVELESHGLLDSIRKLCTHHNPEFQTWLRYKRGRPPSAAISSARREANGGWSFPRGRLEQILNLIGHGATLDDRRLCVAAEKVEWRGHKARPYQRRLIDTGLEALRKNAWCAGVWRSPQGSGKTDLTLELISKLGLRTLAVVPTQGILGQWVERSRKYLGSEPGIIHGNKSTIGSLVTVGMQQTLVHCIGDFAHYFGAVVFDEAQLGAARTYQEVIDAVPAMFRLAVSADEHRADGKEFLIYDQFGPVTGEVFRDEVLAAGGIVEVDVVVVPTEFEADWYTSLEPDEKFTKRGALIKAMGNDTARNELAIEIARRCLGENEQVLLLASERDHCERLDAAICNYAPSVLLIGDAVGAFERNREELASGSARAGVGTYKAIGVGFESHPDLARGVLVTPVASNDKGKMQFNQFLGRFARPAAGKQRAVVYYMLDVNVFGKKPATLIRRWCGNDRVTVLLGEQRVPINEWLKKAKTDETQSSSGNDGDDGTGNLNFFGF